MIFALSKIIYGLIAPSNFCLILMGLGLVLGFWPRRQRFGRRLSIAGFVLLLIFGFSPLGKWIAKPLDDRFAAAELPTATAVTHIIFLGGFERTSISRRRKQISTNAAGERLLAIPLLALRYPQAKVMFSGGHWSLLGLQLDALQSVTGYLVGAGVARERIVLEGRSRNTWENAKFVKTLLDRRNAPCPCGILLVTSAWHMSRAMGVFRRVGFAGDDRRLYAYPVDFRTRDGRDLWLPFRTLDSGLRLMDLAFKEWVGLVAYRLLGRTSTLWPGPGSQANHTNAD